MYNNNNNNGACVINRLNADTTPHNYMGFGTIRVY